jgi:two-component system KDP operon response regulator KdpE
MTDRREEQAAGRPAPPVPTRVLLVLDQPMVAGLIGLTLRHGIFETRHAVSAAEALVVLGQWRPHVVLLDLLLEGVRGARVMEQIRPAADGRVPIPVIALARRGDLRTKMEAFERGADDIMTLPCPLEELLARVVALARRSDPGAAVLVPVIRLGELEVDILQRSARDGAGELPLTPLEQSLLYLLAANAGRAVTRAEILDTLWGPDHVVDSKIVDRQVRNLRARLKDDRSRPRFIATVPGHGYRFLAGSGDAQTAER